VLGYEGSRSTPKQSLSLSHRPTAFTKKYQLADSDDHTIVLTPALCNFVNNYLKSKTIITSTVITNLAVKMYIIY